MGFDPSQLPDDFDPSQAPADFDPSQFGDKIPDTSESQQSDDKDGTTENTSENTPFENPDKSGFQSPPDKMPSFGGNDNASTASSLKSNLILYGICFLIMIAALFLLNYIIEEIAENRQYLMQHRTSPNQHYGISHNQHILYWN